MKDLDHLSADDWDEHNDPRPEITDFDHVVASAVSRRGFLTGVLAIGSGAAALSTGLLSTTSARAQEAAAGVFQFDAVPTATDATVHVPEGYDWQVVARWGDPLFSDAEPFDPETGVTLASSDKVFGENTDGMEAFVVDGRQLIAINHEYVNVSDNLPQKGDAPFTADDVTILQNMQGVTVMEIAEGEDGWGIVVDSPYNRRIHHNTPMRIAGPAAGHDMMKTGDDPEGTTVLGTMNNCGAGKTPWGTYLTCEENFNGYFGVADPEVEWSATEGFARYGIGRTGRYGYELHQARYDISQEPNEPNRHGYITEIDPSDPESMPVKRTALGRIKHENAAATVAPDGRVVVYMGDDERGEYLYKYVSNGTYTEGGPTDGLLDDGQLFVAKFQDDMSGRWVPLTPETTGMEEVEILVHTRMAASAAGGTTMDRPEWVAVSPVGNMACCALTNNRNRAVSPNAGGDPTPVNGPNPRAENNYGQVVRWMPDGNDHAAQGFSWDLYVMAGNPIVGQGAYAGSDNVNEGNLFNSPDGMQFDSTGLLWIQTDGDYSNEGPFTGMGNNQMLAGDPESGEIRRFMTGPYGSEVTGLTWAADLTTMFFGIQHPAAPFPDGPDSLPRSALIAVRRADGAAVG
ncbi:PhoX family phosphatase [Jannaschia sp.]|nr:PhoX family phosphatase [Jannaschia sp.]